MRKLLSILFSLVLLVPAIGHAQVAISASDVADALLRPLTSAKLCFAPVDATETPTGFRVGSVQVVPNTVCGTVSNGVLQSGLTLAPSASGTYYHIWVANRTTNAVIRDYGMTAITGSSWTLDTYDPSTATLPVSTISIGTITNLPPGSNPTATITGGNPALLNLGIPQGQTGATGAQGPSFIPGMTSDGANGAALSGALTAAYLVDQTYPVYSTAPYLTAAGGDHCQAMYLASEAALGGTVGPGSVSNLQGPYSAAVTYANGEMVLYHPSTSQATGIYEAKNSPSAGTAPSNTTYWTFITWARGGFIVEDAGLPVQGTTWGCSVSPTFALTPQGTVSVPGISAIFRLAPGATYVTDVPWAVPNDVWIDGQAPHVDGTTFYGGATIQVSANFETNYSGTPVISAIVPYGVTATVGFGAQVKNLAVVCRDPAGTVETNGIAYYNGSGQEYTGFDGLETYSCHIGADIDAASGTSGQYAGPYNRLKWHGDDMDDATAACAVFGGSTENGPAKEAANWSCIGGANATEGTAGVQVQAGSVKITGLDCESWTYCVETNTAHSSATGAISLDHVQLLPANYPGTAAVYIGDKAGSTSISLSNISSSGQYVVQDTLPGGLAIPAYPGATGLGYVQSYVRNGSVVTTSSPYGTNIGESNSILLSNCGGGPTAYGPVQDQSLTGGCALAATSSTQAVRGIWATGQADGTTSHHSSIATSGLTPCDFGDNSVTNGDWVQAGNKVCTDVGTTLPTTWYLGHVTSTESPQSTPSITSVTNGGTAGTTSVTYNILLQSTSDPSRSAISTGVTTTTSNSVLTSSSSGTGWGDNTITVSAAPPSGYVYAVCRSASGASGNGGTTGLIGWTSGTTFVDEGQPGDGTACTDSTYTSAHVIPDVDLSITNPAPASGVSGPGTTTTGDAACWSNTTGTGLSDCGPHGAVVAGQVAGCQIHSTQTGLALTASFQPLYTCAMTANTMASTSSLHCVAYWIRGTPTTGVTYEWTFGTSGTASYSSSTSTSSTGYAAMDTFAYGVANEQVNGEPLVIGTTLASAVPYNHQATEALSGTIDVELQVNGSTAETDTLESASCWVTP